MSVGVMRDGATFSFCLPTAHKNKKQGLTTSSDCLDHAPTVHLASSSISLVEGRLAKWS
jgi:hypothetical protein